MRSVAASIATFLIFVVAWLVVGALLTAMGWVASNTGYSSDGFLLVHVILIWVLSPGVGAAIAIVTANSIFRSVPLSTIYISFVSICAAVLVMLLIFGINSGQPIGRLLIMGFQAVAIFVGAFLGRLFSYAQLKPS